MDVKQWDTVVHNNTGLTQRSWGDQYRDLVRRDKEADIIKKLGGQMPAAKPPIFSEILGPNPTLSQAKKTSLLPSAPNVALQEPASSSLPNVSDSAWNSMAGSSPMRTSAYANIQRTGNTFEDPSYNTGTAYVKPKPQQPQQPQQPQPQRPVDTAASALGGLSGRAVGSIRNRQQQIEEQMRKNYNKGTKRVTGPGDDPTEDTVPAMLAPGEAVLNKEGAEIIGRDVIQAANEKGAQRMGLRCGSGSVKGGVLHAVKGENYVVKEMSGAVKDAAMKKHFPNPVISQQEVFSGMQNLKSKERLLKEADAVMRISDKLAAPGAAPAAPAAASAPSNASFFNQFKDEFAKRTAAEKAFAERAAKATGNAALKVGKFGLKASPVGVIGYEAYDAARDTMTEPEGDRAGFIGRRGIETAGRLGSAWLGAKTLGAAGAVAGGPFAPVTGPLGAVIGGVGGYMLPSLGYTTDDEADANRAKAKKAGEKPTVSPWQKMDPRDLMASGEVINPNVKFDPSKITDPAVAARYGDDQAYNEFFSSRGITPEMRKAAQKSRLGDDPVAPRGMRKAGLVEMDVGGGSKMYRSIDKDGNVTYTGMGAPSRIADEQARANDPNVQAAARLEELRQAGLAGNEQAAAMYNQMIQAKAQVDAAGLNAEGRAASAGAKKGDSSLDKIIDGDEFYLPVMDENGQITSTIKDELSKAEFKRMVRSKLSEARKVNPNFTIPDDPVLAEDLIGEFKNEFALQQMANRYGSQNSKRFQRISSGLGRAEKIDDLTIMDWLRDKDATGGHTLWDAVRDDLWTQPSGGTRLIAPDGVGVTIPHAEMPAMDNLQRGLVGKLLEKK